MSTGFPTPRERAVTALLHAKEIAGQSRPEAFITGFEIGWQTAIDLAIQLETAINAPDTTEHDEPGQVPASAANDRDDTHRTPHRGMNDNQPTTDKEQQP